MSLQLENERAFGRQPVTVVGLLRSGRQYQPLPRRPQLGMLVFLHSFFITTFIGGLCPFPGGVDGVHVGRQAGRVKGGAAAATAASRGTHCNTAQERAGTAPLTLELTAWDTPKQWPAAAPSLHFALRHLHFIFLSFFRARFTFSFLPVCTYLLMYLPAATHSAPNGNTSGYDLTAPHEYIVAVLSRCRPRSRAPPWPIDARVSAASANGLARRGSRRARARTLTLTYESSRARSLSCSLPQSPSRSDPRRRSPWRRRRPTPAFLGRLVSPWWQWRRRRRCAQVQHKGISMADEAPVRERAGGSSTGEGRKGGKAELASIGNQT